MASVLAHSPPELPVCQTRVQAGLCVARHKDSPVCLSFSQAGRVQVPLLSPLHLPGGSWTLLAEATDAAHLNLPKGQCPGLWPGEMRERGVDAKITTRQRPELCQKPKHCIAHPTHPLEAHVSARPFGEGGRWWTPLKSTGHGQVRHGNHKSLPDGRHRPSVAGTKSHEQKITHCLGVFVT